MNVYLTGHNGFVGRHVHQELRDRGHSVFTSEVDLTKESPNIQGIDFIIDVASRAEVSESMESPAEFIMDNVAITLGVLSLARSVQPKRIVHISSAEIYGPGEHSKNDPHRPNNPYAASKAAQDSICRAYREALDLPISIAVTQNVWGEGQPENKFYPQIKKRVLKGEKVQIVEGVRRFTHVDDLAMDIVDLLEEPVGDYHLAGELMTNLQFAEMIASDLGKPLDYEIVGKTRPGHESVFVLEDVYGR